MIAEGEKYRFLNIRAVGAYCWSWGKTFPTLFSNKRGLKAATSYLLEQEALAELELARDMAKEDVTRNLHKDDDGWLERSRADTVPLMDSRDAYTYKGFDNHIRKEGWSLSGLTIITSTKRR
jgi:hypothetical protein